MSPSGPRCPLLRLLGGLFPPGLTSQYPWGLPGFTSHINCVPSTPVLEVWFWGLPSEMHPDSFVQHVWRHICPGCGHKRIYTDMRKSGGRSNTCSKGKEGAWEGAQGSEKKGPPWPSLPLPPAASPVMLILADHLDVPSSTLCLTAFICCVCAVLVTAKISWMSSKISGLLRSRIFMRSLSTMMMFCVRSSAPCLELFSAAPAHKDSRHCTQSTPSQEREPSFPLQGFLIYCHGHGVQVNHPPKARAARAPTCSLNPPPTRPFPLKFPPLS